MPITGGGGRTVAWEMMKRLGVTGALAGMVVLGLAPAAPASAAPLPVREGSVVTAPKASTKPTAVTIEGKDLEKITVGAEDRADLFNRVLSEVNWLSGATPSSSKPADDKLGPKYTVTVLIGDKANQVYDVYPSAAGGPRAYRPASQPTGKKTAGWFYGRLTMSESLRIAGVPLEEKADVVSGGIGGGMVQEAESEQLDPMAVGQNVMDEFQRLFLINGAVLLTVLAGLAGVAFLIRRKV